MLAPGLLFSPVLRELKIPHAFSTREGGVSSAPFDTLNFGNPMDLPPSQPRDPVPNILENFSRVLGALGISDRELVQVYQVHGNRAHLFRRGSPSRDRTRAGTGAAAVPANVTGASCSTQPVSGRNPSVAAASASSEIDFKADALVTDDPGRAVAVRVADCCPVLLATRDGEVVAAVHAGWRGVVSDVVRNAAQCMAEIRGRSIEHIAGSLVAAIGPCIGPSKFEVGPEVVREFESRFGAGRHVRPHPAADAASAGKAFIDLQSALAEQLRALGVTTIDRVMACTATDPVRFFSHRRDKGVTGRMIGLIAPRANTASS